MAVVEGGCCAVCMRCGTHATTRSRVSRNIAFIVLAVGSVRTFHGHCRHHLSVRPHPDCHHLRAVVLSIFSIVSVALTLHGTVERGVCHCATMVRWTREHAHQCDGSARAGARAPRSTHFTIHAFIHTSTQASTRTRTAHNTEFHSRRNNKHHHQPQPTEHERGSLGSTLRCRNPGAH